MKRIALIVAYLLVSSGCATSPEVPETFKYACAQVEAETGNTCEGREAPIVIESYVVEDLRLAAGWAVLNGVYYGEEYIFIHPKAKNKNKTIVHETVHYILHKPSSGKYLTRCQGEKLARTVSDRWAGDEYSDAWLIDYKCIPKIDDIASLIFEIR